MVVDDHFEVIVRGLSGTQSEGERRTADAEMLDAGRVVQDPAPDLVDSARRRCHCASETQDRVKKLFQLLGKDHSQAPNRVVHESSKFWLLGAVLTLSLVQGNAERRA
jgi:hypothetical protein